MLMDFMDNVTYRKKVIKDKGEKFLKEEKLGEGKCKRL